MRKPRFPVSGHYLAQRQNGSEPKHGLEHCEDRAADPEVNIPCDISPMQARSTFLTSFSPNGSMAASTHNDRSIRVVCLKTGKQLHCLRGHTRTPWTVCFHPTNNDLLASGCLHGEVRIWDLKGGGCEVWSPDSSEVIASLCFHPTDNVLFIARWNKLCIWDWSASSEPFATCETNDTAERVRWVKFDPLGRYLYTGVSNCLSLNPNPSSLLEDVDVDNDFHFLDHDLVHSGPARSGMPQGSSRYRNNNPGISSASTPFGVSHEIRPPPSHERLNVPLSRDNAWSPPPTMPSFGEEEIDPNSFLSPEVTRSYGSGLSDSGPDFLDELRSRLHYSPDHTYTQSSSLNSPPNASPSRDNPALNQLRDLARGVYSRQVVQRTSDMPTAFSSELPDYRPSLYWRNRGSNNTSLTSAELELEAGDRASTFTRLLDSRSSTSRVSNTFTIPDFSVPYWRYPERPNPLAPPSIDLGLSTGADRMEIDGLLERSSETIAQELVDEGIRAIMDVARSPIGGRNVSGRGRLTRPVIGRGSFTNNLPPPVMPRGFRSIRPHHPSWHRRMDHDSMETCPLCEPATGPLTSEQRRERFLHMRRLHDHDDAFGLRTTDYESSSFVSRLALYRSFVNMTDVREVSEVIDNISDASSPSPSPPRPRLRFPTHEELMREPRTGRSLIESYSIASNLQRARQDRSQADSERNLIRWDRSRRDDRGYSMTDWNQIVRAASSSSRNAANSATGTGANSLPQVLASSISSSSNDNSSTMRRLLSSSEDPPDSSAPATSSSSLLLPPVVSASVARKRRHEGPNDCDEPSSASRQRRNSSPSQFPEHRDSSASATSNEQSYSAAHSDSIESNAPLSSAATSPVTEQTTELTTSLTGAENIVRSYTVDTEDGNEPATIDIVRVGSRSDLIDDDSDEDSSSSAAVGSQPTQGASTTDSTLAQSSDPFSLQSQITSLQNLVENTRDQCSAWERNMRDIEQRHHVRQRSMEELRRGEYGPFRRINERLQQMRLRVDERLERMRGHLRLLRETQGVDVDDSGLESLMNSRSRDEEADRINEEDSTPQRSSASSTPSFSLPRITITPPTSRYTRRFLSARQNSHAAAADGSSNRLSAGSSTQQTQNSADNTSSVEPCNDRERARRRFFYGTRADETDEEIANRRSAFLNSVPSPFALAPPLPVNRSSASRLPTQAHYRRDQGIRPSLTSRRVNLPFRYSSGGLTTQNPNSASTAYSRRRFPDIADLMQSSPRLFSNSAGYNITYRIQRWDMLNMKALPEIEKSNINVVIPQCKIHNDSSISISQDGRLLAAFIPTARTTEGGLLGLFSLESATLGRCLYMYSFGSNAISVSISPLNRYVLVGIASKRLSSLGVIQSRQMVAQVYKLGKQRGGPMSWNLVTDIFHPCAPTLSRSIVSVNSAQWLPLPGQGLIYGTNRGDLHICRPGPRIWADDEDALPDSRQRAIPIVRLTNNIGGEHRSGRRNSNYRFTPIRSSHPPRDNLNSLSTQNALTNVPVLRTFGTQTTQSEAETQTDEDRMIFYL